MSDMGLPLLPRSSASRTQFDKVTEGIWNNFFNHQLRGGLGITERQLPPQASTSVQTDDIGQNLCLYIGIHFSEQSEAMYF